jgi:integrase
MGLRNLPRFFPNFLMGSIMKLANGNLKRIDTEGKADFIAWDDDLKGFGLRIRQGKDCTRRTWIVQYKSGIHTRRSVIGDADLITPAQARAKAKTELAKVELGQDPQGEKKAKRVIGTFKSIAQGFVEHQEEKQKRNEKGGRKATIYASKLYLLGYCKTLHPLRPDEIGRTEIATVLGSIAKACGPVSADRARAALSSCFRWAIGEGKCPEGYNNPVAGTNTKSEAKPRGRALDGAELAAIWNAAGDDDFGRIIKLLILTGCRRNEIAKLEWDEVQDDLISLPETRTKNHLRFDVPLTALARSLIGQRPDQPRKYVFGRYSTSEGFGGFSKAKAQFDAKLGDSVKPWRLHDLRHTVSTMLHQEIGIEPHIVEAVLNHVSGAKASVAGRYNHAAYNVQKRAALEKWESHVKVLAAKASGANVTKLKRA